jgi:hypothetical protein
MPYSLCGNQFINNRERTIGIMSGALHKFPRVNEEE